MPGAAEKRPASPTDRNVPHARPACEVVDRADRAGNARFSTKVNGANHLSRIGGTRTGGGSGARSGNQPALTQPPASDNQAGRSNEPVERSRRTPMRKIDLRLPRRFPPRRGPRAPCAGSGYCVLRNGAVLRHVEPRGVEKRFFEFADDRLTLRTPPLTLLGEAQVHRLIWQRSSSYSRQCGRVRSS
jgi:hypothetical protein